MWALVKTVFKHFFTGKDNQSFELMRALTALSVVSMLFFIGWHLIVNKEFSPLEAAGGLGSLLFGGAAGAAIKDGTLKRAAPLVDAGPQGQVSIEK